MSYEEKPLSELIGAIEQKDFVPIEEQEINSPPKEKKSNTFMIVVLILLMLIGGMGGYYVYSMMGEQEQKQEEEEVYMDEDEDEEVLSTWEEQITLASGKTLKITKTDTSREGLTYTNPGGEGSGERKIFTYFQDINKMTEGHMFLGRAWDSNVVKSSQEKVALNNIEYQYIFKISGYNVSAAGIGAVYQWSPKVMVHGYDASRIRYYYNPPVEDSLALEGYYPKGHKWAGEPYTSGEYTGEGTEVVLCVFDLSSIFPNQSGFLVFDWGDLVNSPFDNCEHINEFKEFKLSVI